MTPERAIWEGRRYDEVDVSRTIVVAIQEIEKFACWAVAWDLVEVSEPAL